MNKNLKLEHLAPYLPYNLTCKYDDLEFIGVDVILLPLSVTTILAYQAKPILRPLSDLAKHCEDLGFVPIEKMKELFIENLIVDDDGNIWLNQTTSPVQLSINVFVKIQTQLFKWHFDVFGLIDDNLAIDINIKD